jgi:two-component system, LytTR family, sensor kinase
MDQQQLILMLVNVSVALALASVLARIPGFPRMLLREERTMRQRMRMALAFGAIFGASVLMRVITGAYQAVDLALPGALLAGLLGGYATGVTAGILISIPAMANTELLSMPLFAGAGILGGLVRDCAPDKEEIWRFSPLFDVLGLWRLRSIGAAHGFRLLLLASIVLAEFFRRIGTSLFPGSTFLLTPLAFDNNLFQILLTYSTTVLCVFGPLKIWNLIRVERSLAVQSTQLTEARLAALSSQINPHFLFNTLNSINTLIRVDPDRARQMIIQLSSILRRLLRQTESLTPLRDEMAFIEDYVGIEMTRFGDKLRYVRETDPTTLDDAVPAMLLQPIVENSIKHGLSNQASGGVIHIRSRRLQGLPHRLLLEVEDNGSGITDERMATLLNSGIGVSNVNERLKVLYGSAYRLSIESKPGEGTRTEIELPLFPPTATQGTKPIPAAS